MAFCVLLFVFWSAKTLRHILAFVTWDVNSGGKALIREFEHVDK